MRYWTRLIIVGLVFLVLGGIVDNFNVYANDSQEKNQQLEDDMKDIDRMRGLCNSYGNAELCNRVEKAELEILRNAQGEYQGSSAEKIDNCYKKGYSKLYCDCTITEKGIYLNTEVPFIGLERNPKCLVPDGSGEAGANVLTALTKILMTFVLIGGFGALVRAGTLIASSGGDDTRKSQGMNLIRSVVIAFALLGSLGVILRFINPNFFT